MTPAPEEVERVARDEAALLRAWADNDRKRGATIPAEAMERIAAFIEHLATLPRESACAHAALEQYVLSLREALETIAEACDAEIKTRFHSDSKSETEVAGASRIYPLLALPRNIARVALAAASPAQDNPND